MVRADFHMHSTASDGQYTPTELVRKVKAAGITHMALTDHDTLAGVDEARRAGQAHGVCVFHGVELGAQEARYLHIVGLNFRLTPSPLTELCQKMKDGRDERKYRIIRFLAEKGIHITLDEVEQAAGGDIIGRPHFAKVLLERGFVQSRHEAFDRYLDTEEYQKIERFKPSAQECIAVIHAAGGKAVLAHPHQLGLPDDALHTLIGELRGYGLDGMECRCAKYTEADERKYRALAQKYGLHPSAGSDFHGEAVRPDRALMPTPLDIDWLGQVVV